MPLILNLSIRWTAVVSLMSLQLYKRLQYPTGGLVGPGAGLNFLEKKSLAPAGI